MWVIAAIAFRVASSSGPCLWGQLHQCRLKWMKWVEHMPHPSFYQKVYPTVFMVLQTLTIACGDLLRTRFSRPVLGVPRSRPEFLIWAIPSVTRHRTKHGPCILSFVLQSWGWGLPAWESREGLSPSGFWLTGPRPELARQAQQASWGFLVHARVWEPLVWGNLSSTSRQRKRIQPGREGPAWLFFSF